MGRYDVVIVGGGPAGLSAALMLGRCRRSVLVCDSGQYRNAASHGVHGFLSRDGIDPAELLQISREQLKAYGVELRMATVKGVRKAESHFTVSLQRGANLHARRVLLATGVVDRLPEIENIDEFYGTSVHHCPYCDAWEHRGEPLAAYGRGRAGIGLALSLRTWSDDVVLCTNGRSDLTAQDMEELRCLSIPVRRQAIARLEGHGGKLERIIFRGGDVLPRRAIFFNTGQTQRCSLAQDLGCQFTRRGAVRTDKFERTCVPGLFAVGDCSRNAQFVVMAAAEGTVAAEAINVELQAEDRAALLQAGRKTGR